MFKIKLTKKPKTGSQADYGLIRNSTFVPTVADKNKPAQTMGSLTKEDIKNGKRPTIEVEGEEEVVGDVMENGTLQKFRFKGPSHAEGGMPVDIPQGSFIYSKKLKMKDQASQEEFGLKPKKEGYSFSDVAKKYDINTFTTTLEDPSADPFAKRTAQLMLQKNTEALAILADKQEEAKGYPGGRAAITKQVLGVPDVPAQVEDAPTDEAACGGSLKKAQIGGQNDLNTYWTMGNSTKDTANFLRNEHNGPGNNHLWYESVDSKNKPTGPLKDDEKAIQDFKTKFPTYFKDDLTESKSAEVHNEPFVKANLSKDFRDNYSKIAKLYKNAFYTGDPDVMLNAAKQISDSRGLTGDYPGFMDMFKNSDSDKFSDMASVLQEEAGKNKTKLYLDKATELHKRAYKHYMDVKNSNDYTPEEELKAKKYAEKLYKAKQALQSGYDYETDRPFSAEGYIDPANRVGADMLKYIDKHSNIKTPSKQGVQKLKGKDDFDYKFDSKNKVWTYSSDKTNGKFYEVTNLDSVKRLNKGEGYTLNSKEKSKMPTNQGYNEATGERNVEMKKDVINVPVEKPAASKQSVVKKQVVQQEAPAQASHPVWNLDELALGGDILEKYQSDKKDATVNSTAQPIEEVIVGKSGQKYKAITYPDGSSKLFKEDGTLHSEKPAGSIDYESMTKVKTQPVQNTPERHQGQFTVYGSPAIQDYVKSHDNVIHTAFDKGHFGNQKRVGTTGIYLSSADAKKHQSGDLSDEEWADFNKRHGDWIDKEYQGGFDKFKKDLQTSYINGDKAAGWFQDQVNAKSKLVTGSDYFTEGKQDNPYRRDSKFGHVTYSVPRFFDLPEKEKPASKPGEEKPDEKSKDTFEGTPGDPIDKMPDKIDGWYLPDLVNFGAALGQKTEDFRPVKGSMNASMQGYVLGDPTAQVAGNQANQARLQDLIQNSVSGNAAVSAGIGASAEQSDVITGLISNMENQNGATTNQAFAQNAQIQNQQNAMNASALQKFVQESADFGNNKVKEQNMKNAQLAALYNAGADHEGKRKAMEQVLFPQAAMNPMTGDWFVGGKGRDIFGPDTYTSASGSSKNGRAGTSDLYKSTYDDLISKGVDADKAHDVALKTATAKDYDSEGQRAAFLKMMTGH